MELPTRIKSENEKSSFLNEEKLLILVSKCMESRLHRPEDLSSDSIS